MNILFAFLIVFTPLQAILSDNPIEKIAQCIKNADVSQFNTMLDESISLTILGEENVYFKGQAEVIIERFFKSHVPDEVKTIHRVESNASYKFAVYQIKSATERFRLSVQMRQNGGNFLISELKIEETKF